MSITKFWFNRHSFFILIGLAGVHSSESVKAQRWGRFFGYVVLVIAILLLIEWQLPVLSYTTQRNLLLLNWCIWLFLVVELICLMSLVKYRWRFLLQNWLLPIIIVLAWPLLLDTSSTALIARVLRPLLAIIFVLSTLRLLTAFFLDGQLRTTILATIVIVVVFGLLVAGVDPNIKSAWDGIWWALATVSTVGYGDVVPSSLFGRLIGAVLVLLGLGVFVIITANFLALTLRKEAKQIKKEERNIDEIADKVESLQTTQLEILHVLNKLEQKN
ncbi:MAG: potassium channel family protein [Gammaproteobacteria bacterium]|nr:potassium channel family protein [Gammaproteobacteria bacterium]